MILNWFKKRKEDKMEKELFDEVDELLQTLVGKEGHNHNAETIGRLFRLHNKAFINNAEYSQSCNGCRVRVYNRLKSWWSDRGGVKK